MPSARSRMIQMAAALSVVLTAGGAWAASAPETAARIALAPASRLTLRGKSTLHDYASSATRMQLEVQLADELSAGPLPLARLAEPGAVKSVSLTIPVDGMKSEKQGLDKNMYKALGAAANPNIVFRLRGAAAPTPAATGAGFHLTGELEVAGQSRPIEIDLRAFESPEGIVLEGSKALLMSDYGVKPPKMFLGTLKTDDRVVVDWRLVLANAGF